MSAIAEQDEVIGHNLKAESLVDLSKHGRKHRVIDLLLLATCAADQVVMLLWMLDLVVGLTAARISSNDQARLDEYLERAIYGRAIERQVPPTGTGIHLAKGGVTASRTDGIQDETALASRPVSCPA